MENKIYICINYEYRYLVFEDINVFCSTMKKYIKLIKSQYYFSKNDLFALLRVSFKVKPIGKNTKTEEEIKDFYICDFSTGWKPTFVIADENGKIISKID